MPAEPVIDLERLTVTFGESAAARDVSLHVLTGELYELVGTNGPGRRPRSQQRAAGGAGEFQRWAAPGAKFTTAREGPAAHASIGPEYYARMERGAGLTVADAGGNPPSTTHQRRGI